MEFWNAKFIIRKSQDSKEVHSYHALSHFYKSNYPHILIGSYQWSEDRHKDVIPGNIHTSSMEEHF